MKAAPPPRKAMSTGLGKKATVPAGAQTTGEPIELRIEDVEEDPDQPRQTFTEAAMKELVESIQVHGVKVPISVHRHPEVEERYVINDGARRYRASMLAGNTTILAVVVEAFSLVEQLVVNKVRDDTPPKDKARAFARIMRTHGWTQREVAERSGLSTAYVSQHLVLLDLPAVIGEVFDNGRCADVTTVSELVKAYRKDADAVEAWLQNEEQEVTRAAVKQLRVFLENRHDPFVQQRQALLEAERTDEEEGFSDDALANATHPDEKSQPSQGKAAPAKAPKTLILGTYKRKSVRLIPGKRWSAEGMAWVQYEDSGEEVEIELAQLRLNRLVRV